MSTISQRVHFREENFFDRNVAKSYTSLASFTFLTKNVSIYKTETKMKNL